MSSSPVNVDPRVARYEALLKRLSSGEMVSDLPEILSEGRGADGLSGSAGSATGDSADGHDPSNLDSIDTLGAAIVAAARGISEQFTFERALADVSTDIVRGLYFDDVMNHVYDSFRSLIPYDRIGCALLENNYQDAVARWGRTDGAELKLKAGYSASLEGSSLRKIIETGEPRIINDLRQYGAEHPKSKPTRLILAEGINSSLTCPLVAMGRPVGFMFFSSRQRNTYGSVHTEVFLRLATAVSVLLEKSLLYEDMMELNAQLRAAQHELEHRARHDGLTGLLNHTAVTEALERRLVKHNSGLGLAVLMIDIDHFKMVNDRHGHRAGDEVLRVVADAIARRVRSEDLVGRYGGEEFLVAANVHSERAALGMAEDLRMTVAGQRVEFEGATIAPTVSIGLAYAPAGDTPVPAPGAVIAAADAALYAAKDAGRNRVMVTGL